MSKTISVDIYSKNWYNNVRWIPSPISRPSPLLGYDITLYEFTKVIKQGEVWIYDANTKRIINLDNLKDYFPEYDPGGGGGGSTADVVLSNTTAGWNAQPTLVAKKDMVYVYTDYFTDSLGNPIAGLKVGDGVRLLKDIPFTGSSVSESGGGGGVDNIHSDTTTNWDAQTELVALKDHLYIYTDHRQVSGLNIPGMKVGDGTSLLSVLPFLDTSEVVITPEDIDNWNNKVSAEMSIVPGNEEELILYTS